MSRTANENAPQNWDIPRVGEPGGPAYISGMADKPDPKADDSYSEEETAKRRDATIRAMIGMKPKPHRPTPRTKTRSTSEKKLPSGKKA